MNQQPFLTLLANDAHPALLAAVQPANWSDVDPVSLDQALDAGRELAYLKEACRIHCIPCYQRWIIC
jgi:hypothetical protein